MSTPLSIPRARWLRRFTLLGIAMVGVVLGTRFVAQGIVERRLAKANERLQSLGIASAAEGATRAATQPASTRNAATVWQMAFTAVGSQRVDSPRSSKYESTELGEYPPYEPLWHQLADASESANRLGFAYASSAAAMPECDWGTTPTGGYPTAPAGLLNSARNLANLLCDSSERAALRGEWPIAMKRLRANFALGDAVRTEPSVVSQLVAMGIDAVGCRALRAHVGSLPIGTGPQAVPRDEVRALIDQLMAVERIDRPFANAMRSELAAINSFAGKAYVNDAWLNRPVAELSALRALEQGAEFLAIGSEPPGEARAKHVKAFADRVDDATLRDRVRPRDLLRTPSMLSVNARIYTTLNLLITDRRIAAVALATRLYQADHDGQMPPSLDALVPAYLPSIPHSALSPSDAPLEYVLLPKALPDGRDRPLLFVDFGDGYRGEPRARPDYDLDFGRGTDPATKGGRWSDLTSWTPPPQPKQTPEDAAAGDGDGA